MASSRSLLMFFVALLTIASVIPGWVYNFGVKVFAYDIFAMIFLLLSISLVMLKPVPVVTLDRTLKTFLLMLAVFWLFKLASGLGVLTYVIQDGTYADMAKAQFIKGIAKDLFVLIVFVFIAIFMSQSDAKSRQRIILTYVFAILVSCIYQYISLVALVKFDIELDKLVWPSISYSLPEDFRGLSAQIYGNDGIIFYRAGGFALNPNNFAAQLVCIIPFLILFALHKRKSFVFLAVMASISMIITISRSGMLALFFALILLVFGNFSRFLKTFKVPLMMVFVVLLVAGYYYGDKLLWVLGSRFDFSGKGFEMGMRSNLNDIALTLVTNNPVFGVGVLNSPIQLMHYSDVAIVTGTDLHSYWLTKFVELGVPGFAFSIFFYGFILFNSARFKGVYGKALFYSLFGLVVAGLFNNNLSTFPVQLFIFVFYCAAALEHRDKKNLQHPVKTSCGALDVERSVLPRLESHDIDYSNTIR